MTTIYKVLDPTIGQYTDCKTKDELLVQLSKLAYKFYMSHTHNNPYTMVTINEDGSETWRNAQGEEILSPAQIEEMIQNQIDPTIT